MGYRSDVVAAVATRTKEDLQGIITAFPAEKWAVIKDEAEYRHDGAWIYFQFEGIKWYSERDLGYREEGFDLVNNIEDFIRSAERLNDGYDNDEPGGIASTGVLVRIGEDSNDTDEWTWMGFADDLPYTGDLAYISQSIVVDPN